VSRSGEEEGDGEKEGGGGYYTSNFIELVLCMLIQSQELSCWDLCVQEEMTHMTSLHLNAARIGHTQDGERQVGPYKDAGQREFVGQVCFVRRGRQCILFRQCFIRLRAELALWDMLVARVYYRRLPPYVCTCSKIGFKLVERGG